MFTKFSNPASCKMKISSHSLSKKYLRKVASHIDMNVNEFIVHAYPIQNEEFLLRFSHLTNYLDRYVVSKTGKYKNVRTSIKIPHFV
jgi:hypothetical protein